MGPCPRPICLSQAWHLTSLTTGPHASQTPVPGRPPGDFLINAPNMNSAASPNCSPASVNLLIGGPPICPMAKARSPGIIQNASPTTLSTQIVPKTRESQPQCPSNLSASHLLPGDDTCLLSGHSMLSLSHSPTQLSTVVHLLFPVAIRCSSHHLQKEAPPQKRRPKHCGQPSNPNLSSKLSPVCYHSNQPELSPTC